MPGKVQLKKTVERTKGKNCSLTNQPLPDDLSLFDTHRQVPKRKGGAYTLQNTDLAIPTAHMEEHGSLRKRKEELEELKRLVDERNQVMKLKVKIGNQLLANKRKTDTLSQATIDFLQDTLVQVKPRLAELTKQVETYIRTMDDEPLVHIALKVKGIGPITVAYCLVYIDLEKARHASSLWAYAGLDKPKHKRYVKGVKGGGNKTLRTVLYAMAESQMKTKGVYRSVYDRTKLRLSNSSKLVETKNTKGFFVTVPWKDTKPSHRHGAALRNIMKHFLADYWFVGRTLLGLETTPLYPEAILGGTHRTIMPEERGWVY